MRENTRSSLQAYITQYQEGKLMEIIVDKDKKLVEVWLSRIESEAPETEVALKLIYDEYSKKKFKAVVFRSGGGNLNDYVEALIRNNRAKLAKNDLAQKIY